MLLDIGPPFFGLDRDCPYSRRSPAFVANRSLRPSLFPAILLASARRRLYWRAAMDRVSRLLIRGAGFRETSPTGRPAGQPSRSFSHIGPASIDGIPDSAHQARKSRIGCSLGQTHSRPTGFPKSRQWTPTRFAAFAVICSEISTIVRFVPVNLPPIIPSHRGKGISYDHGNFVVAGNAGEAHSCPFGKNNKDGVGQTGHRQGGRKRRPACFKLAVPVQRSRDRAKTLD